MKLSLSAYKRYMQCPQYYAYHRSGLRPVRQESTLLFGSAIDDMINALLDGQADPLEAYKDCVSSMDTQVINWDKQDYDGELLSPQQRKSLLDQVTKLGYKGDNIDDLAKVLFQKIDNGGYAQLSVNQHNALIILCTASLYAKAELILHRYKVSILPQLERVESVQKEIELSNGKIMGVSDYVAIVKGHGRVLLDNKTSVRPYAIDAARYDAQLTLYAEALGCDKVGFVVMQKNIKKNAKYECSSCGNTKATHQHKSCPAEINKKRCGGALNKRINPVAQIDLMIEDCGVENKKMVVETLEMVYDLIQLEKFPKNLGSCNWMYGKPCPYREYCWKGDKSGLRQKENS